MAGSHVLIRKQETHVDVWKEISTYGRTTYCGQRIPEVRPGDVVVGEGTRTKIMLDESRPYLLSMRTGYEVDSSFDHSIK